jgi:hypothetical protein
MRYRFDPLYPPGRRGPDPTDAHVRASDEERNEVADALAHHYAAGRLDGAEFKVRLDTAMSATRRGDLRGLFDDLPPLPTEPPAPPTRRHRMLHGTTTVVLVVVLAALAAAAAASAGPFVHVPWILLAVLGFVVWRRTGHRLPHHAHHGHHGHPLHPRDTELG